MKKKVFIGTGVAVVILAAAQFVMGIPVTQNVTSLAETVETAVESGVENVSDIVEAPQGEDAAQEDAAQEEAAKHADSRWGNPETLQDHFDRHGGDFNATDPEDYARQANKFYENREEYQVKMDEHGIARIYDEKTNTFGAYNKNGTTRSFFKPSAGQDYFDRQPGD